MSAGREPGFYVSRDEELIGEGPFPTLEAATKYAQEDMREEEGIEPEDGFTAFICEFKEVPFKLSYAVDIDSLLENVQEDLGPELSIEDPWPTLTDKQAWNLESEITSIIEQHLRAAGKWPRLASTGRGTEIHVEPVAGTR